MEDKIKDIGLGKCKWMDGWMDDGEFGKNGDWDEWSRKIRDLNCDDCVSCDGEKGLELWIPVSVLDFRRRVYSCR